IATLDVLTSGRLILGVGLGYREREAAAFGIERAELRQRFDANLAAVRALCTTSGVTIDLPWCHVADASLTVQPTDGMPPVWMAAHANAAVRRAARLADAWFVNPHADVGVVRQQLAMFRAERANAGRGAPLAVPVMREVFCAPTTAE